MAVRDFLKRYIEYWYLVENEHISNQLLGTHINIHLMNYRLGTKSHLPAKYFIIFHILKIRTCAIHKTDNAHPSGSRNLTDLHENCPWLDGMWIYSIFLDACFWRYGCFFMIIAFQLFRVYIHCCLCSIARSYFHYFEAGSRYIQHQKLWSNIFSTIWSSTHRHQPFVKYDIKCLKSLS